jgi:hypothetical protein
VLDSVFIGPAQRDTLQVVGPDPITMTPLPPIYLSDQLQWIQDYVGAEAQDVIQNAGRFGLGEDFTTMIGQLYSQAYGLYYITQHRHFPANYGASPLPPPMSTPRVQQSLYKLVLQLRGLYNMAVSIGVTYLAPRA